MAYDEGLAQIFEDDLAGCSDITSRKMFGGLCFMHRCHMLCGVHKSKDKTVNMAMFRVGADNYAAALSMEGVEELAFTGRPMKGIVETGESVFENDTLRTTLINLALQFTQSLPAK